MLLCYRSLCARCYFTVHAMLYECLCVLLCYRKLCACCYVRGVSEKVKSIRNYRDGQLSVFEDGSRMSFFVSHQQQQRIRGRPSPRGLQPHTNHRSM